MGKVYTPTPITNIETAESALNQNFSDIEAALESALDRQGAAPNQMEDALDLNSQDAINIGNLSAETIQAGTILAGNVLPGSPTVGPLIVIERKKGRFDNTANTFPKILGLSGAAVPVGNVSLLSGAGILVPSGVGALSLSFAARCMANQNFAVADIDIAAVAGFSRIVPTDNDTTGTGTNEGLLTVEPIVGAPVAFGRPGNWRWR